MKKESECLAKLNAGRKVFFYDVRPVMNVRAYVDIGEMEKTKKYIFSQSGYKLKCIFHKEQTPSAHITEDGRYVCFGCGVKMKARLNKKVITDNGIIDGDFYEIYSEQ